MADPTPDPGFIPDTAPDAGFIPDTAPDAGFAPDSPGPLDLALSPFKKLAEMGPYVAGKNLLKLGWKGSELSLDSSALGPIKKQMDEDIGDITSKLSEYAVKAGIPDKVAQTLAVSVMSTPALLNEFFMPTNAAEGVALGMGAVSGPGALTLAEGLAKGEAFSAAASMPGMISKSGVLKPLAMATVNHALEHPGLSSSYRQGVAEKVVAVYQEKQALSRKIADQMNDLSNFIRRNSGKNTPGFSKEHEARLAGIEKDRDALAALDSRLDEIRQNAGAVLSRGTTPEGQSVEGVLSGTEKPAPVQTNAGTVMPNPGPAMAQAVAAMTSIAEEVATKARAAIIDPTKVIIVRKGRQVTETIMNMIVDGQLEPKEAARYLGVEFDAKESVPELISRIRGASTGAGQLLNRLSQTGRYLQDLLPKDPELAQRLSRAIQEASTAEQTVANKLLQPISGVSRSVINTWRALLVTQIGTSVRNALSQGARVGIGIFDDAVNGSLRYLSGRETGEAAFSNAWEDMAAILRRFSPEERNRLEGILTKFPAAQKELGGHLLSDVTLTGQTLKTLNYLNSMQETYFRKIAFDARLRSNLTRLGLGIEDFPGMEKSLSKMLVDDSVRHALEMTFAESPARSSAAGAILNLYSKIPVLSVAINPFPRFWMNAVKFASEFSPLGLMYSTPGSRNPELAYRGLSRATTGTLMYGAAFAFRNSAFAGEKWYEVKPFPDTKPNYVVDIRNFYPFAATAFVADLVTRTWEVRKGIRQELGYTPSDIMNAVIAMRRTDFAGIPILDGFFDSKTDITSSGKAMMKALVPVVGNFVAGWATPVKNIRDIVEGGWRGNTLEIKDTKESPLTGPLVDAIPFARENLPAQPSVTRPGSMMREDVIQKQLLGLAGQDKTKVETELAHLDISKRDYVSNSGDREMDRLIAAKVGPAVDVLIYQLMNTPGYKDLTIDERRKFAVEQLKDIAHEARAEVLDERPDLGLAMQVKRLPAPERTKYEKDVEGLRLTKRPRLP